MGEKGEVRGVGDFNHRLRAILTQKPLRPEPEGLE
jgi:hypothetical protein